ncbi:MAG: class B sortase [Agathobacter sp.]|nr:class B sortase [Agathobacter sp.]
MAIAFVIALAVLIRNRYVADQAGLKYNELAGMVNSPQTSPGTSPWDTETEETQTQPTETQPEETETEMAEVPLEVDIPEKTLDWDVLRKENQDIYAWIYIPGTAVDYPVLQHPTDDTHYLNYNLNGSKGYPGCIYSEKINSKNFTDFNTILYGHNMLNGTMFASLHYFETQSFFDSYPYIFVYREDQVLVYEVFAAYKRDDKHILYAYDFETETGRQEYLDEVLSEEEIARHRETELTTNSHILTLSTCIRGEATKRYLVQAKLLNEKVLHELGNE